jgi:hypothetical protein
MDTKIIIFLAFTCVTLVLNSVIIWYAYKAFLNITTTVTKTISEAEASKDTRVWLKTLESASKQAVSLTGTAKTQLTNFDPVLARAHAKYEFKLAEIDAHMEKSIATVLSRTRSLENAVVGPAHRIGATLSGVHEVIQYLSGEVAAEAAQDQDKNSTPTYRP